MPCKLNYTTQNPELSPNQKNNFKNFNSALFSLNIFVPAMNSNKHNLSTGNRGIRPDRLTIRI